MGKTQGVNDRSNPETKNPNKERRKLLLDRVLAILSDSDRFFIGVIGLAEA